MEFAELGYEEKKLLLKAFNYDVDKEGFITNSLLGEKVISKETQQPLTIQNAALIPGSLKIIDSDPLTLSKFLREKLDSEDD